MEVNIKSIEPDELAIKFDNEFIFSTWQEVFDFIKKVDLLYQTL